MTDKTKPPLDYPYDEWQDTGDYHVPAALRAFYADAEPTPQEMNAYMAGGVEVAKPYVVEHQRAVGSFRADLDPAVATEEFHTQRLVPLNGADGYREWLHIIRIDHAWRAKQRGDSEARIAARWLTCGVCGSRDRSVNTLTVPTPGASAGRITAHVCPHCQVLTETALRERVLANVGCDALPDGRTIAQAVNDYVDELAPEVVTTKRRAS